MSSLDYRQLVKSEPTNQVMVGMLYHFRNNETTIPPSPEELGFAITFNFRINCQSKYSLFILETKKIESKKS